MRAFMSLYESALAAVAILTAYLPMLIHFNVAIMPLHLKRLKIPLHTVILRAAGGFFCMNQTVRFLKKIQRPLIIRPEPSRSRVHSTLSKLSPVFGAEVRSAPQSVHFPSEP